MKKFLPLYILLGAIIICALLLQFRPKPKKVESLHLVTPVEFVTVKATDTQIIIESEGILNPKTESAFISEVSGKVIDIGENFYPGSYFEKDEVLFEIDSLDYVERLKAAEFQMAQATLYLAEQNALAEQAKADWEKLNFGKANDLVLRKPQLNQAVARIESAKASVDSAEGDLQDTTFKAPYAGFLLSRNIDLGTVVNGNMANAVAQAYGVGNGEIRLPISEIEKQLLAYEESKPNKVRFYHASTKSFLAEGTIDRIEATLNSNSRLFYCVGEITDAFSKENITSESALQRSQFLVAEIEGKLLESAFTIPNAALRNNEYVYIINEENRLIQKKVTVIHKNKDSIILSDGLAEIEKIVTSPIPFFVENMSVEPIVK
jgi:RND family efflux transporter MFP subunit